MLTNEDIARAFLREAQSDLNCASVLLTVGEYARCVAHAQHTVEKTLKAVLAARRTIITYRHQVAHDFAAYCVDVPDAACIAQIGARKVREHWQLLRISAFWRPKPPHLDPFGTLQTS